MIYSKLLVLIISLILISCGKENVEPLSNINYISGYLDDEFVDAQIFAQNKNYYKTFPDQDRSTLNIHLFTDLNEHNHALGGWNFRVENLTLNDIVFPCIIDMYKENPGRSGWSRGLTYPSFSIFNDSFIVNEIKYQDEYFYLILEEFTNNTLSGSFLGKVQYQDVFYEIRKGKFNVKIKEVIN